MLAKNTLSTILALILLLLSTGSTYATAPHQSSQPVDSPLPTDRIIIQYKTNAEVQRDAAGRLAAGELAALSQRINVHLSYVSELKAGLHVLQMEQALPAAQVEQMAQALASHPSVAYAEPDYILTTQWVPNDPLFNNQWHYIFGGGIYGANLPPAWDITQGDKNVVIAVVDSGYLPHPDLAGRWLSGYDFVSSGLDRDDTPGPDGDPSDPGTYGSSCSVLNSSWHGLHVIGTIAANSNNALDVSGVTWNNDILPVRAMGICGSGYLSDIAFGMRWAAGVMGSYPVVNPRPARVINLSLGGLGSCGNTFQSAINEIRAAGAVVVVAAGNSGVDASQFSPANCQGVITVAATTLSGNKASYSNHGSTVEISAPGGGSGGSVLSLGNAGMEGPGAYTTRYMQGTSMAAPHVSGVVGLMLSVNSELTPDRVTQVLQKRSTPFPGSSNCLTQFNCGTGILNAGAAVQEAQDLFRLKHPNEFQLVFAGANGALRPFTIRTYENGSLSVGAFSVTIGGAAAAVTGVADRGNYWEATIQPPNQPNDIYDITVTINGVSVTHQNSVIYGLQSFLPNVRR